MNIAKSIKKKKKNVEDEWLAQKDEREKLSDEW